MTEAQSLLSGDRADPAQGVGFCAMTAMQPLHGHGTWTVELRDGADRGGVAGFVPIGGPGDREHELGGLQAARPGAVAVWRHRRAAA